MSEQLNIIKEIRKEIIAAKGDVDQVAKSVVSLLQEARQFKGTFKFDTPQGTQSSLKANSAVIQELNDKLAEQEKINARLQKQIERLANVRAQSNKRTAEEIENTKILSRNAREFAKIQSNLTSEYEKLSVSTTKLKRQYKDLAVQQAQGNELTEEQVMELEKLEKQIIKNVGVLKSVDAKTGDFQRNVGNYKSAFDGLGFSITQLTREAPAFANSVQTGFMAISNNIPMAVDEINKLRKANKALAAEGKPTKSVLKSIGAALFSFQTLLSVGVTLLTLYGKEIFDWLSGLSDAEKAQKKLNEAMSEANSQARNSTQEYRVLRSIVEDTTNSELSRAQALEDIKEKIPELKDVTLDLLDANDGINDANVLFVKLTDDYIKAVTARAKATAFANLAAEAEAELIKRRAASLEDESEWYDYVTSAISGFGNAAGGVYDLVNKAQERRNEGLEADQKNLDSLNNKYQEYLTQALELEAGLQGLDDARDEEMKAIQGSIAAYEKAIRLLQEKQSKLATTSQEYEEFQLAIDSTQQLIDELNGAYGELLDKLGQKFLPEDIGFVEAFKRVKDELGIDDIQFIDIDELELAEEADILIRAEQDLLNRRLELRQGFYNQLQRTAISAINAIFQTEANNYQEEIQANAEYYDALLQNQQLTEEQRSQIEAERAQKERQLEEKRRQAERKSFLLGQAVALGEVAVDTFKQVAAIKAQAAVLAANPVTAALAAQALAQIPFVIGTGAAAAAAIAATTIPQFKDGVINYEGGLAVVGDGGKQEPITDSSGQLIGLSPSTPTLVNLPKGSNVYSSVADPGFINHVIGMDLSNGSRSLNQAAAAQSAGIETAIKEALSKVTNPVIHNHQKGIDYSRLAKELSKINKLESI